MTNILEKIDIVRERTGCSYEKAKFYLDQNDQNVVEAIIAFEQEHKLKEEYEVSGENLLNKIKELIKEGNVRKIIIKQNDKVVLNIPVNFGIVALVLAPYLAVIGAIIAVSQKYTIEVDRE
jgi:subtilase family serine protease